MVLLSILNGRITFIDTYTSTQNRKVQRKPIRFIYKVAEAVCF